MEIKAPKSISRPGQGLIKFEWKDGYTAVISLEMFRKECPCAGCKGETIAGKHISMPSFQLFTPGMYELKSLVPVGNYAVTASWGDGHDTGIYHWEYIRDLCDKYSMTEDDINNMGKKTVLPKIDIIKREQRN